MTRTLPWLKQPTSSTGIARPSSVNLSKRKRVTTADSDRETSVLLSEPKDVLRAARYPSSSPPPMQSSPTSSLRPGLQADDIYIMVEDEFNAIAQTFTKHLHRAAYQEIKNKAKQRQVQDASDISRPTDGVTRMGPELKQRKRADALRKKTKKGMEELLASAAQSRDQGSDESESDFDVNELDPPDDGWQGTQLQDFIMTSPKDKLKSLTGVQRVKSHTRAAAGFAKTGSETMRGISPFQMSDEEETEDTDDLDEPIIRKEISVKSRSITKMTKQNQVQQPAAGARPNTHRSFQARRHSAVHESSDSESAKDANFSHRSILEKRARVMPRETSGSASLKSRLQPRQDLGKLKRMREERPDERPMVEEIPLFM